MAKIVEKIEDHLASDYFAKSKGYVPLFTDPSGNVKVYHHPGEGDSLVVHADKTKFEWHHSRKGIVNRGNDFDSFHRFVRSEH